MNNPVSWVIKDGNSTSWRGRIRFWRIELMYTVHRHTYPQSTTGDRWVIQPHLIYDRKSHPKLPQRLMSAFRQYRRGKNAKKPNQEIGE